EVRSTPTTFTPPNRDDFTFGRWTPWWQSSSSNYDENKNEELAGHTDADGKHRLRVDFDSVKPARPFTVMAEATVQDVNRQEWTSTATMRSEEHTSELQSRFDLVCRLLLEKKKKNIKI